MQHIQLPCCFRHIFIRQIQHRTTRALHNVLVHLIVLSTHNIAVTDAVSAFLGLLRSWKRFLGKNLPLGRDTISNCFFKCFSKAELRCSGCCPCRGWCVTGRTLQLHFLGLAQSQKQAGPMMKVSPSFMDPHELLHTSYIQPLARVQISENSKSSF